jgi:hypothetical protein
VDGSGSGSFFVIDGVDLWVLLLGKVNVKLPLCLTKHHAMKAY